MSQLELRTPMFADISRELTFENPEGLMAGWFQGMDPRILERTPIAWGCAMQPRTHGERRSFPWDARSWTELSNDHKLARSWAATFATSHYTFTPAQLKELLARATRP